MTICLPTHYLSRNIFQDDGDKYETELHRIIQESEQPIYIILMF
jgi:hypothetical protein